MEYNLVMIIISFIFGGLFASALRSIITRANQISSVNAINSIFKEVLFSIDNSRFITRVNSTVTIEITTGTIGTVSLIYMVDREDVAIFKDGSCIYTSDKVDADIISNIIKRVNSKFNNEINDVVSIFGFIFSRVDFESKFKMKIENGMLYPLEKEESDVAKIISKNSSKFTIDEILDKINTVGIDNLSVEEKEFLKMFKS